MLWHLRSGPRRFNELRRLIPGVSSKMLTQQLRALERDGLVHRTTFHEVPARVEYTATLTAAEVYPILEAVYDWWRTRWPDVEAARSRQSG